MKPFSIILCGFLFLFFLPISSCQATRDSLKEKLKDVLLIINFNSPYYSNIEFLKELYSPFFSKIIFYGEKQDERVNYIHTEKGVLLSRVIKDVLERYPDFKGYLFVQDDCVLNMWNYLSYDLEKIWLPATNGSPYEMKTEQKNFGGLNVVFDPASNNDWWRPAWAYSGAQKAFSKLTEKELSLLEANAGKNMIPAFVCDMFYIPQKHRIEMLRLSDIFHDVFYEIAVPCMMSCLALHEEWEKTSMLWGEFDHSILAHQWPIKFTCIHPIKFSSAQSRQYTIDIFKKMIQA